MWMIHDEDEWETVVNSRPCTACQGHLAKCNGRCNGSFSVSQIRRDPVEVKRIKAGRERQREDSVLAEAETIRTRREREDKAR